MLVRLRVHSRPDKPIPELREIITNVMKLISTSSMHHPEIALAAACDLVISHPHIFRDMERELEQAKNMIFEK